MFENFNNMFKGMFGRLEPGTCKLTMNGNVAVRTSGGYKAFNVKKGILTNVTNFCFNADEMFFIIPTNKVAVGDIIFASGRPKCVISVEKGSKVIEVIDYENSEIKRITPERHVFMGSTYFYGKIVSMFGNAFTKGKGIKNVIKMMMLSNMMGGNNNAGSNNNGMGQMMMMSMLMGGNNNMFEGVFDFDFDEDEDEENPLSMFNEDEDDEDEAPAPKKSKKVKKDVKAKQDEEEE